MLPLCRTSPGRFAESARLGTQLDLPHCSASETNSVATSPPLPGPRTPQSPAHEDLLNTYYSKPGVRKFEENARSTWIAVHHSTGWPLTCPHSETTGHFESVLPIVKPACSPFFYLCVKTTSSPMFSRTHPNATQSRESSTWRPVSDQHSRARPYSIPDGPPLVNGPEGAFWFWHLRFSVFEQTQCPQTRRQHQKCGILKYGTVQRSKATTSLQVTIHSTVQYDKLHQIRFLSFRAQLQRTVHEHQLAEIGKTAARNSDQCCAGG